MGAGAIFCQRSVLKTCSARFKNFAGCKEGRASSHYIHLAFQSSRRLFATQRQTGKKCNRSHFPVAVAMARLSNAFKASCTAAQTCCSRCHDNNKCRKGGSLLWLAFGLRLTVAAGQRERPPLHMLLLTNHSPAVCSTHQTRTAAAAVMTTACAAREAASYGWPLTSGSLLS